MTEPDRDSSPGMESVMGFSDSRIGHLASQIADDFARSGKRAQTLSPSSVSRNATSRTAGGESSFCGWPDAQWPEFSQSTLKAAGARAPLTEAVHMGEDAPATPALNYRIRTTSSEARRSRSSSPGELHPSEPQIDAGRRGVGKGWEVHLTPKVTRTVSWQDSNVRGAQVPVGALGDSPDSVSTTSCTAVGPGGEGPIEPQVEMIETFIMPQSCTKTIYGTPTSNFSASANASNTASPCLPSSQEDSQAPSTDSSNASMRMERMSAQDAQAGIVRTWPSPQSPLSPTSPDDIPGGPKTSPPSQCNPNSSVTSSASAGSTRATAVTTDEATRAGTGDGFAQMNGAGSRRTSPYRYSRAGDDDDEAAEFFQALQGSFRTLSPATSHAMAAATPDCGPNVAQSHCEQVSSQLQESKRTTNLYADHKGSSYASNASPQHLPGSRVNDDGGRECKVLAGEVSSKIVIAREGQYAPSPASLRISKAADQLPEVQNFAAAVLAREQDEQEDRHNRQHDNPSPSPGHRASSWALCDRVFGQSPSPLQPDLAGLLSPDSAEALDTSLSRTAERSNTTPAPRKSHLDPVQVASVYAYSGHEVAIQNHARVMATNSLAQMLRPEILEGNLHDLSLAEQHGQDRFDLDKQCFGAGDIPMSTQPQGMASGKDLGSGIRLSQVSAGGQGVSEYNHGDGSLAKANEPQISQGVELKLPALEIPSLPVPLTPLGYTPRRTQLDDASLQYLVDKWGGRQGRGSHEYSEGRRSTSKWPQTAISHGPHAAWRTPTVQSQASRTGQEKQLHVSKHQGRASSATARASTPCDMIKVSSGNTRKSVSPVVRRKWTDTINRNSPPMKAVSVKCNEDSSRASTRPVDDKVPSAEHARDSSKISMGKLQTSEDDIEDNYGDIADAAELEFEESDFEGSASSGQVLHRSVHCSDQCDAHLHFTPGHDQKCIRMRREAEEEEEGEEEEERDLSIMNNPRNSDANSADISDTRLRVDRYTGESSVSTECPSIRESLMAASAEKPSSASTNRTQSVASWRRTLDALSPSSPSSLQQAFSPECNPNHFNCTPSQHHDQHSLTMYNTPQDTKDPDRENQRSQRKTGDEDHGRSRVSRHKSLGETPAPTGADRRHSVRLCGEQVRSESGAVSKVDSAPLIRVDAYELNFYPPCTDGEECQDQVLLLHNVSSAAVALSYSCLDEDRLLGKVPSKTFTVRGSRLDATPILSPGQTSSLTVSCRDYLLAGSAASGTSTEIDCQNDRKGMLAIVAIAVSDMLNQNSMRQAHCEQVLLRRVMPLPKSPPLAESSPANSAHHISKLHLESSPRSPTAQSTVSKDAIACGNLSGYAASGNIRQVSGVGGDSWFVDCSEMDLGNVYVQDLDRCVMAVRSDGSQGSVKGLLSITNPSSVDLHFEVCTITTAMPGHNSSDPAFVVGPTGQEAQAASYLELKVPARHSRQLQVFLDTSTYDFAGRKECTGELRISKIVTEQNFLTRTSRRESIQYNSTCIPLSCVAGFCRLQIPGDLEQVHMACMRGEKAKQGIALRNGGNLPASVRLSVEDEEDALGRPLSLIRGSVDESLSSADVAQGAAARRGQQGIFRIKHRELLLAPGQVTKVMVTFAPPASSTEEGRQAIDGGKKGSLFMTNNPLIYKSRLVLRVVEDGGVHYSVPLRGHASRPVANAAPAAQASAPGLPLSSIFPRSHSKPPGGPLPGSKEIPPQLKARGQERSREAGTVIEHEKDRRIASNGMINLKCETLHASRGALPEATMNPFDSDVAEYLPRFEKRMECEERSLSLDRMQVSASVDNCNAKDCNQAKLSEEGTQTRSLTEEEGTQTSFYGDAASADLRALRHLRSESGSRCRTHAQLRKSASQHSSLSRPSTASGATANMHLYTDHGAWEEMCVFDEPCSRDFAAGPGLLAGLPDGLIVPFGEEVDTWPPWRWAEEEWAREKKALAGRCTGGKLQARQSSTRVHFPETRVGDVSVVKVALCNRSRADALITLDLPRPCAFRVRHHQVRVRAQHYLMLPVYFVPVERGKARDKLSITCPSLDFSRRLILSATAS